MRLNFLRSKFSKWIVIKDWIAGGLRIIIKWIWLSEDQLILFAHCLLQHSSRTFRSQKHSLHVSLFRAFILKLFFLLITVTLFDCLLLTRLYILISSFCDAFIVTLFFQAFGVFEFFNSALPLLLLFEHSLNLLILFVFLLDFISVQKQMAFFFSHSLFSFRVRLLRIIAFAHQSTLIRF